MRKKTLFRCKYWPKGCKIKKRFWRSIVKHQRTCDWAKRPL